MENNTILKDQEFNDIIAYIYERYKDWYLDADFVGELQHQEAVDRVEDIIEMFLGQIWVGESGQYLYHVDASYLLEDILEAVAEYFRGKGLAYVDDEDEEDENE